jgi:hypothetical protein
VVDIRAEFQKDYHIIWCACAGGNHGIMIGNWDDEEWFVDAISHPGPRSLREKLRDAWRAFQGRPYDEIIMHREQLEELRDVLDKELKGS